MRLSRHDGLSASRGAASSDASSRAAGVLCVGCVDIFVCTESHSKRELIRSFPNGLR